MTGLWSTKIKLINVASQCDDKGCQDEEQIPHALKDAAMLLHNQS